MSKFTLFENEDAKEQYIKENAPRYPFGENELRSRIEAEEKQLKKLETCVSGMFQGLTVAAMFNSQRMASFWANKLLEKLTKEEREACEIVAKYYIRHRPTKGSIKFVTEHTRVLGNDIIVIHF